MNIYTYRGFGDCLSCYSIIKEYAKSNDKIYYYSDSRNELTIKNAKRLYSSIPNVEIISEPCHNDTRIDLTIANNTEWYDKLGIYLERPEIPLSEELEETKKEWISEYQWYLNANVPFNLKWDNFYLERNLEKEKEIYYDILGLKDNEEFIFLHEDLERGFEYYSEGYKINRDYIKPDIKIIELSKLKDISILDITYVLERAEEIHTFNSGVAIFADLMLKSHEGLYYHHYVRANRFQRPYFKLNWAEIIFR